VRHQFPSSSRLALYARQHRSHLNAPEQALWSAINAGKLGISFRRQVVMGNRYIVDFLAPSQKLVVEVDGQAVHQRKLASDARRDAWLRQRGYRIVRVSAQLVLSQLPLAVAQVRAALRPP
jgi:very-short-patch-repair endonuclease